MKTYRIRTLSDVADRLADPATRDNFKKDLLHWIEHVDAKMLEIRAKADRAGVPFRVKSKIQFDWIDDGAHRYADNTKVVARWGIFSRRVQ